jgi:SAM-dependent methyltransferase
MPAEQKIEEPSPERIKKAHLYWQGEEGSLQSMFQRANFRHLAVHEKQELIGYFPDLNGKKILDLAAGIGRFTRYFSERAKELVSVDLVSKFVEKNRNDHADCQNVAFLCQDAMNLHFESGSFDFIFINWLFLYLEDKDVSILIRRIHDWLSLNGMLFFRETCDVKPSMSPKQGYVAYYRPPVFYENLIQEGFEILQEGHLQTYVDCFADPLHCYWLCKKRVAADRERTT